MRARHRGADCGTDGIADGCSDSCTDCGTDGCPDRCAHGSAYCGTDRRTLCGTHRRANPCAHATPMRRRLARLRQDGWRHLLRGWREQLHVRLQRGLLGELGEPARVRARHRRADRGTDGIADRCAHSGAH